MENGQSLTHALSNGNQNSELNINEIADSVVLMYKQKNDSLAAQKLAVLTDQTLDLIKDSVEHYLESSMGSNNSDDSDDESSTVTASHIIESLKKGKGNCSSKLLLLSYLIGAPLYFAPLGEGKVWIKGKNEQENINEAITCCLTDNNVTGTAVIHDHFYDTTILDIDIKDGGIVLFDYLVSQVNQFKDYFTQQKITKVKTKSGGYHYYFKNGTSDTAKKVINRIQKVEYKIDSQFADFIVNYRYKDSDLPVYMITGKNGKKVLGSQQEFESGSADVVKKEDIEGKTVKFGIDLLTYNHGYACAPFSKIKEKGKVGRRADYRLKSIAPLQPMPDFIYQLFERVAAPVPQKKACVEQAACEYRLKRKLNNTSLLKLLNLLPEEYYSDYHKWSNILASIATLEIKCDRSFSEAAIKWSSQWDKYDSITGDKEVINKIASFKDSYKKKKEAGENVRGFNAVIGDIVSTCDPDQYLPLFEKYGIRTEKEEGKRHGSQKIDRLNIDTSLINEQTKKSILDPFSDTKNDLLSHVASGAGTMASVCEKIVRCIRKDGNNMWYIKDNGQYVMKTKKEAQEILSVLRFDTHCLFDIVQKLNEHIFWPSIKVGPYQKSQYASEKHFITSNSAVNRKKLENMSSAMQKMKAFKQKFMSKSDSSEPQTSNTSSKVLYLAQPMSENVDSDVSSLSKEDLEESVSVFLTHLHDIICDSDPSLTKHVLSWLAHIIQKPYKKTGICLVISSPVMGAGKSIIGEIMHAMIGSALSFIGTGKNITDNHSVFADGKIFIALDEFNDSNCKYDEIKEFITSQNKVFNPKCVQARDTENFCNLMFTTNHDRPIKVEDGDRRYTMIRIVEDNFVKHGYISHSDSDDKKLEKLKYMVSAVAEYKTDPFFRAALFRYLSEYDISDFDYLPYTTDYKRRLMSNQDSGHKVFHSFMIDLFHPCDDQKRRLRNFITGMGSNMFTNEHGGVNAHYINYKREMLDELISKLMDDDTADVTLSPSQFLKLFQEYVSCYKTQFPSEKITPTSDSKFKGYLESMKNLHEWKMYQYKDKSRSQNRTGKMYKWYINRKYVLERCIPKSD